MDLEGRLSGTMENILVDNRHRLALYAEKLKGLSPLDKLSQGYAYVEDGENKVVNSIDGVKQGDVINIYVKNGTINASVNKTMEVDYGEGADA
jgi:exodeoxyribonuclease VII large subunit